MVYWKFTSQCAVLRANSCAYVRLPIDLGWGEPACQQVPSPTSEGATDIRVVGALVRRRQREAGEAGRVERLKAVKSLTDFPANVSIVN